MEQIKVDLLCPLAHADRPVRCEYDIVAEYIMTVVEPYVRVQRVGHEHIILTNPIVALAQFQAAIQAEIVVDAVVRAAIVQIDIPAVIAAPPRI